MYLTILIFSYNALVIIMITKLMSLRFCLISPWFPCVVEIEVKLHNILQLYNILLGRVFPFTSGDVAEIQDKAPLSETEGTEVVSWVFMEGGLLNAIICLNKK